MRYNTSCLKKAYLLFTDATNNFESVSLLSSHTTSRDIDFNSCFENSTINVSRSLIYLITCGNLLRISVTAFFYMQL